MSSEIEGVRRVFEVKMPQLGETVADGTVTKWFKKTGDTLHKGEPLFEVSTDKVDTEIPSPAAGTLVILVDAGATVDVGTVVATIAGDGEVVSTAVTSARVPPEVHQIAVAGQPAPIPSVNRPQLSPVVRKLLAEHGLEPDAVTGTGPEGRITKDDVLHHVAALRGAAATLPTQSPVVRKLLAEHGLDAASIATSRPDGRLARRDVENHLAQHSSSRHSIAANDEVIPFTRRRQLTAEHMVRSKATSAHTLMVREVDYEAVEHVRRRYGAAFKEDEGFSLTYLPFNAMAALLALREFPHLNASVGDNTLIVHRAINLGIAVDLNDEGLVVPVVHSADALGLRALARSINQRAVGARNSSLGVDDYALGTFTITNPGPFGTLMTGAIINQPQVAILSTDGVVRRPVVVSDGDGGESIAIHSTGLLALTFDHRAVDGAYAARFLRRVATILHEHDWADML